MYVNDVHSRDVRSEGMSYGMMIAVQMDKKADFDAMWNWAKTYMYISDPKHPSSFIYPQFWSTTMLSKEMLPQGEYFPN